METSARISVLVERVGDWWVAQCIQHDLATQARSLDELQFEIRRLLTAHIASCEELGIRPFELPPAPPEVHARFEQAKTRLEFLGHQGPQLVVSHALPTPEIRIAA